jgi:GNAT superfamily N-acetyltransferase
MTSDELLQAYDQQVRQCVPAIAPAGYLYERVGPLVRLTGPHRGFIDPPRDLEVRGVELDALIASQREFFAARGEGVEWKTRGHDEPADVPAHLLDAGFCAEEQETVTIGLAQKLATEPTLPSGVRLRQVVEAAGLSNVAAMESTVWDADLRWMAKDLATRIASAPDDVVVLVAEADGEVVSAGWSVYEASTSFAALWGGSTVPEWRGRGIYRALVARRAQLAAARGVQYLQVDASDDSKPILMRFGFVAVTTTTPYVWTPGQAK